MSFPYHVIPDGNAALPHHFTWAMLAVLVPMFMVWDHYPERDPWIVLTGVLGGLVGFGLIWPRYPVIGAMVAVSCNLLVILAPFRRTWWQYWPRRQQAVIVLLGLVAADDSLQHAFGWHTPLDRIWKAGGRSAVVEAAEVVAHLA